MDSRALTQFAFDLSGYTFEPPQQSGALTVVPICGPDSNGAYASPLSGLKLSRVEGYGNVEVANASGNNGHSGLAIVPLHMGYIQDGAQNHALCRSAFIGEGQKLMFRDACCVQEAQGGYLKEASQWFFILPLHLRERALELRGREDYSKLWTDISALNQRFSLPTRGHLEEILCRQRPYLTQYTSRFELVPAQRGALFFLGDRLAGLEIAPTRRYFEEVWTPLICFCYGTAAWLVEKTAAMPGRVKRFDAGNLAELRERLTQSRDELAEGLQRSLRGMPSERFRLTEEERYLDLRLSTAAGRAYDGQIVKNRGALVYASVFARAATILEN